MAGTPEETIQMAADAYMAGDTEALREQLHEHVRIHGSEWDDYWNDRDTALLGMTSELARHLEIGNFEGSLVDFELHPITVNAVEEMAWSSRKGRLVVDGRIYEASWTCVLRLVDDEWRIIHSHFSIHR